MNTNNHSFLSPRVRTLIAFVLDVPGVSTWVGVVLLTLGVPPPLGAASATDSIIRLAGVGPLVLAFHAVLPTIALILSATNLKYLKKRDRALGNGTVAMSATLLVLFFLTMLRFR